MGSPYRSFLYGICDYGDHRGLLIPDTRIVAYHSFFITQERKISHITFLGKYWFSSSAGLGVKVPFLSKVDRISDLDVKEHVVVFNLKTNDQFTLSLGMKVYYRVSSNKSQAFSSAYNIEDFRQLIESW